VTRSNLSETSFVFYDVLACIDSECYDENYVFYYCMCTNVESKLLQCYTLDKSSQGSRGSLSVNKFSLEIWKTT